MSWQGKLRLGLFSPANLSGGVRSLICYRRGPQQRDNARMQRCDNKKRHIGKLPAKESACRYKADAMRESVFTPAPAKQNILTLLRAPSNVYIMWLNVAWTSWWNKSFWTELVSDDQHKENCWHIFVKISTFQALRNTEMCIKIKNFLFFSFRQLCLIRNCWFFVNFSVLFANKCDSYCRINV